jgi:hypothetical protein
VSVHAHSGGAIKADAFNELESNIAHAGEVPRAFPTINQQVDCAADATIDLILMDRGINDVNVMHVDGEQHSYEYLDGLMCKNRLTKLLQEASSGFPKAYVSRTRLLSGHFERQPEKRFLSHCGTAARSSTGN